MGSYSLSQSGQTDNTAQIDGQLNQATAGGRVDNSKHSNLRVDGNLTATDFGAVEKSFDFADDFGNKALSAGTQLASQALGAVTNQAQSNASDLKTLAQSVQSGGNSDNRKLIMYVLGSALVLVGVVAFVLVRSQE